MIRTFDLLDLPTLHRYRHLGLCLDSSLELTWGVTLVPAAALLSYLAPATGIFTCMSTSDGDKDRSVLGQVMHNINMPFARLTFLAPESALDSTALLELLDYLATQVGERGAHNLIADADESTLTYEMLRKAGFAIYARQRIWKVAENHLNGGKRTSWQSVSGRDEIDVRTLYNALVPALVQQVEPPPWDRMRGLVYRKDDNLLAFVNVNYGPKGILLQPFFHPDLDRVSERISEMLGALASRISRNVYVSVRSYQAWLEAALEELEAEPGPRQAVMVKRLAVVAPQHARAKLRTLKGTTANPTVPFAQSISIGNEESATSQGP